MAGGSRTLKLTILGDVDNLTKSLKTAETDTETFGSKVGDVGKKVGVAFAAAAAAAGAYAIKMGVDGVQAAIEDEKAQTQLAIAIQSATSATDENIKSIEAQITKTALATGVADDQLRPALGRLVLSTNDTQKATDLLNLALDVSAATGKPLETVTNALGKAYDGNTAALGKLGIGYGAAELKGKDFSTVAAELNAQFGGSALTAAETYQGQIDRLKVSFGETQETLGTALLPILQTVITFLNDTAMPIFMNVVGAFSDKDSGLNGVITRVVTTLKNVAEPIWEGLVKAFNFIKDAIAASKDEFESFGGVIEFIAPLMGKYLGAVITVMGKVASVVLTLIGKVLGAIKPILNTAIDGINLIIKGVNLVNPGKDIPLIGKIGESVGTPGFSGTTPGGQSFAGTLSVPGISKTSTKNGDDFDFSDLFGGGSTGGTGGGGTGGGGVQTASKIAAKAAETFTTGALTPYVGAGFSMAQALQNSQPTINLTVNGAIDSEGTARTIVETLNDSYYRGTGGAGSLQIA